MWNAAYVLQKAKSSAFFLRILNWSLSRTVPFNKPHGFEITAIDDFGIKTRLPYRKRNFNHIRGLHACALATLCEFTTGFLLISILDIKKYRLILQRLEVDYHYQGKTDAVAEFSVTKEWMEEHIYQPLKSQDAVVVPCEVRIYDRAGNHLTTGKVFWQFKDWQKVKTRVN